LLNEIYPIIRIIAKKQLNKHHYNQIAETTEVVHEAFIKLQNQSAITWKNRNQFFAISTQIIRRLLIDQYRAKNSQKRGEMQNNVTLDKVTSLIVGEMDIDFNLLEFDGLLNRLASLDKEAAQIVELRFYGGLTQKEIADVCNISKSAVTSNWNFARSWLLNQLSQ
jgi:RNA polymerase sigma factor (TIGR02999 family)